MAYWSDRTLIVTGGTGFLGSYVVEGLRTRGCKDIVVPRQATCDLRDPRAIANLLERTETDMAIDLAAVVDGCRRSFPFTITRSFNSRVQQGR